MRSSNYKHLKQTPAKKPCRYAKPPKKAKKISWLGSIAVTAFVVFGAVIIPGITLIQDVNAVTIPADNAIGIDTSDVFPEVITDSECKEEKATEATEATSEKKIDKTKKSSEPKATETAQATTVKETEKTAPQNKSLVAAETVDTSYNPKHISLSSYDREKLERLVMGEAGDSGYTGAALVAQTIRDTMEFENTGSIDYIIDSYQYQGSTDGEASDEVKNAVSYIFDENGYAVQHRLLYFYAPNIVNSEWHETQQFIVFCDGHRFFDRW